jgi:hypothetical protein
MKYAIDSYLNAKKKWGKINQLQDEIDKVMKDRAEIEEGINSLFRQLMKGIASKKTEVKGVAYSREGRQVESNLYLSPIGFGYVPSWRKRIYSCDYGKELFQIIAENKDKILQAIPRGHGDKREIISIFVRVWGKYRYEFKPIRINREINRNISWFPDNGYNDDDDEIRKAKAVIAFVELKDSQSRMGFQFRKGNGTDDYNLDSSNYAKNMIKEQLYLPLWKVLIKAKRRANKELSRIKKIDQELRKEITPFLVARAI